MDAFNIRVYGLLLNDQRDVLVSDEWIRGGFYTKFPGGGMEFGEGTRDCLHREFMEELGLKIEVGDHLYTTDYFQPSAFNPRHQMMSIYYLVRALEPLQVRISQTPFDFDAGQRHLYEQTGEIESFRWIPWEDLTEECVTLPIDKIAVRALKSALAP